MLIVFLFLALGFSIWLTIKPNNLRKFYSRISGKHDEISIFAEEVLLNQSCSSVHLSVRPSVTHFSQDLLVVFLNFLPEDILPYILKGDKAGFWKIIFVVEING